MAIIVTRTNLNNSGKGRAVSFHSAVVNGVILNDLALLPGRDDGHFVSFPSRAYKDNDGKTQYAPITLVEGREDRNALVEACVDGYKAAKAKAEKKK